MENIFCFFFIKSCLLTNIALLIFTPLGIAQTSLTLRSSITKKIFESGLKSLFVAEFFVVNNFKSSLTASHSDNCRDRSKNSFRLDFDENSSF